MLQNEFCHNYDMNNCVKKPDASYRPNCIDEWLELINDIGFDYDGCNTVEGLKLLVDEIVDYANKARKCLHIDKTNVAEIVRCKNCAYSYWKEESTKSKAFMCGNPDGLYSEIDFNDYCSYGAKIQNCANT